MLHTHKVAGSNPAGNIHFFTIFVLFNAQVKYTTCIPAQNYNLGFYGVMVSTLDFESSDPSSNLGGTLNTWLRGATVARLTPDQKAACSNHVGVNNIFLAWTTLKTQMTKWRVASNEDWTHDLWFTRPTLCHWAIEALMGTDVKYFKSSWQPQQLTLVTHLVHIFDPTKYKWLNGLGVWFSLWVREVPGSNPGWAHCFFTFMSMSWM